MKYTIIVVIILMCSMCSIFSQDTLDVSIEPEMKLEIERSITKQIGSEVKDNTLLQYLFSYIMPVELRDMEVLNSFPTSVYGKYLLYSNRGWMQRIFISPLYDTYNELERIYFAPKQDKYDLDQLYYKTEDKNNNYTVYETGNAFFIAVKQQEKQSNNLCNDFLHGKIKFLNQVKLSDLNSNEINKNYTLLTNIKNVFLNGEWHENVTYVLDKKNDCIYIVILKLNTPRASAAFQRYSDWLAPLYTKENNK